MVIANEHAAGIRVYEIIGAPTTDASPTPFGHSFRSANLPHSQGRTALRHVPARYVPPSLPLLPLLALALLPHHRALRYSCGKIRGHVLILTFHRLLATIYKSFSYLPLASYLCKMLRNCN